MLPKMEIEATGESGGFKLRGILNFMAYEIIILNKLGCFSSLVCSKVDLYQGINKNIYIFYIYTHTRIYFIMYHTFYCKKYSTCGEISSFSKQSDM